VTDQKNSGAIQSVFIEVGRRISVLNNLIFKDKDDERVLFCENKTVEYFFSD